MRAYPFVRTRETAFIILRVGASREPNDCENVMAFRGSIPSNVPPSPFKNAESHPLYRSRRLPMASLPVEPPVPVVPLQDCPIAPSLRVLGRTWRLLARRDAG